MKLTLVIVAVLLSASAAFNIIQSRRVAKLRMDILSYQSELQREGRGAGRQQAEQDFASGKPLWYQFGGFGGAVPADRPDRQLRMLGCKVTEYSSAFVEAYNKRMDELFAQRSASDVQ